MRLIPYFIFAALAWAQTPLLIRPTVIRALRLFDGKGETLISPAIIVVEGNRITGVGSTLAVPADAIVVDLGDATLMPGFMDAHAPLHGIPGDFNQTDLNNLRFRLPSARYADSRCQSDVDVGFTTVRDLGGDGFIDVGLRNAINAKAIQGPGCWVAVNAVGRQVVIVTTSLGSGSISSGGSRGFPMAWPIVRRSSARPSGMR
jgi:imidazolonepropionase-like amidohydrolase